MGTKNKVLKEIVSEVQKRQFDMTNAYETVQEAHKHFKPNSKQKKKILELGKKYEKLEKEYISEGNTAKRGEELIYMENKIKLIKSNATQAKLQKATDKYNKIKERIIEDVALKIDKAAIRCMQLETAILLVEDFQLPKSIWNQVDLPRAEFSKETK